MLEDRKKARKSTRLTVYSEKHFRRMAYLLIQQHLGIKALSRGIFRELLPKYLPR